MILLFVVCCCEVARSLALVWEKDPFLNAGQVLDNDWCTCGNVRAATRSNQGARTNADRQIGYLKCSRCGFGLLRHTANKFVSREPDSPHKQQHHLARYVLLTILNIWAGSFLGH